MSADQGGKARRVVTKAGKISTMKKRLRMMQMLKLICVSERARQARINLGIMVRAREPLKVEKAGGKMIAEREANRRWGEVRASMLRSVGGGKSLPKNLAGKVLAGEEILYNGRRQNE